MSSPSLVVSGRQDLSTLPELKARLIAARGEAGETVRLDLSGVDGADVGFVQLLLAFEASLRGEGRSLAVSASDAVRDLLRRLGATLPGVPA